MGAKIRVCCDKRVGLCKEPIDIARAGPLYGAARRLTSSPSDAEDLVQDVCLKAFESIDELERIEFRRAWLLRFLYHKFVDRRRNRSRSPVDQADTGAAFGGAVATSLHWRRATF